MKPLLNMKALTWQRLMRRTGHHPTCHLSAFWNKKRTVFSSTASRNISIFPKTRYVCGFWSIDKIRLFGPMPAFRKTNPHWVCYFLEPLACNLRLAISGWGHSKQYGSETKWPPSVPGGYSGPREGNGIFSKVEYLVDSLSAWAPASIHHDLPKALWYIQAVSLRYW